jgi:isopentenyldiphosphate isomerase
MPKRRPFKPRPDQIDYRKARWAPVINCVIRYRGKILVVRRSRSLNFYPGYWNGISGFLDDAKGLIEKVREELWKEIGLPPRAILKIQLGEIFHQEEPKYKKTWIVHPVLVSVTSPQVKLDWEAEDYRWVRISETHTMRLLPGFADVLKKLRPWLKK